MSSDLLLYILIGGGMVVGNFMAKDSFLYPVLGYIGAIITISALLVSFM